MDEVELATAMKSGALEKKLSRVVAYKKKRKNQKKLSASKNRLRAKNEELVRTVDKFCQEREKWRSKAITLMK